MAKQTSQKITGSGKKRFMLQLTGKGAILWGCMIFLVCGWMFVLGVLVGRGTAPVKFDVQAIQEELIALKESMLKKEKDVIELHLEKGEARDTLEFYQALKEKVKDEVIGMRPKKETPAISIKAAPPSKKAVTRPADTSREEPKRRLNKPQPEGNYAVQVASTKDAKSADEMAARLTTKGYPAFTMKVDIPQKGTWYRVRVGYFKDSAEAESMRRQLLQESLKGLVVRR